MSDETRRREVGSGAAPRSAPQLVLEPDPDRVTRVTRGRGGHRHPIILHNNDARWSVTFLSGFSCAQ